MSRTSTQHALFPYAIEAASILAWGMVLGGLYLLEDALTGPVAAGTAGLLIVSGFLGSPLLVGAVLGWGFDDPDYSTATGRLAFVMGAGLVTVRVATVSMLVWFAIGLWTTTVVGATAMAFLGFFLALGGTLLGRRLRRG